jgi:hypothetical protein
MTHESHVVSYVTLTVLPTAKQNTGYMYIINGVRMFKKTTMKVVHQRHN